MHGNNTFLCNIYIMYRTHIFTSVFIANMWFILFERRGSIILSQGDAKEGDFDDDDILFLFSYRWSIFTYSNLEIE